MTPAEIAAAIGRILGPISGPSLAPFNQAVVGAVRNPASLIPNPVEQIKQSTRQLAQATQGPSIDYPGVAQAIIQGGASVGMVPPDMLGTGLMPTPRTVFHGTATPIKKLGPDYYSGRNIYGEGLYTTHDPGIARTYMKKNASRATPTPGAVYRIAEKTPVKLYDLDSPLDPAARAALGKVAEFSPSAEAAVHEILSGRVKTLARAMDEIRIASAEMGESSDAVTEVFESIKETLRAEGYGGFTHEGGNLVGKTKHQVKIYWDPHEQVHLTSMTHGVESPAK